MQEVTQSYLRKAAIQALTDGRDSAALEIISFLRDTSPPLLNSSVLPANSLPACIDKDSVNIDSIVSDGRAHAREFWENLIRARFLPFLRENGRVAFTSPEMVSWLENLDDIAFTTGDMKVYKGYRTFWKVKACDALQCIRAKGIVHAEKSSKEYMISSAV